MCLCVCFLLFIFPLKRDQNAVFMFYMQTDQADFKDWMLFRPSNFIDQIGPNPEVINRDT